MAHTSLPLLSTALKLKVFFINLKSSYLFAYLLSVSFQENESRTLFSYHLEFAPSQPFESFGCYFLWFLCFTDISLSLISY